MIRSSTLLTAVLTAPLLIAGCATDYKPKIEGKATARVRFITEHPSTTQGIEATFVSVAKNHCRAANSSDISGNYYQRLAILTGNASLGTPLFAMQQPAGAMVRQGMPGEAPTNGTLYSESRVPAGESFPLNMSTTYRASLTRVASCTVAGSFTPEPDTDYQAIYQQVGMYGCAVRLSKYAVGGALLTRPVPVEMTPLPVCAPASGQ
jgi:hypothetical protein